MAALTPPTIEKQVANKVPFLVLNATNQELIQDFTVEVFSELQKPLKKTDAEYLDEDFYKPKETSMISDIVACMFIHRQILINMEGSSGAAATGNKIVKKGKAGEAEAEFMQLKAEDGTKLLASANQLFKNLKGDASRKAITMGFMFDINMAGGLVVETLSRPLPITSATYNCE